MNVQPRTEAENAWYDALTDEQKRDLMANAAERFAKVAAYYSKRCMEAEFIIRDMLPYAEAAQAPAESLDESKSSVLSRAYAFVNIAPPKGARGK